MEHCMSSRKAICAAALVCACILTTASADGGDTSNGATDFTFHGKGRWWHNIGTETELAQFAGPFISAARHPGEIYMTFWKESDAQAHDGIAPGLDSKRVQVLHALGTRFYYPASEPAPPGPEAAGYRADDFRTADDLFRRFPVLDNVFPEGYTAAGCQWDGVQFFMLQGKGSSAVYLVDWVAHSKAIDVALIQDRYLQGSFESVLDGLDYYSSGGMVEFMEFGAHYYYLSHRPRSTHLDTSPGGTAAAACPESPVAGDKGIEYPKSWTDAVSDFKPQT